VICVVEFERGGPSVCPTSDALLMRRSICQRRTLRMPCRLRHVAQRRLHGRGDGAYREFVQSSFIFITEIIRGPQGTTERCRVRAGVIADEAVILEINAIQALLPIHNMQSQTYLRLSGLRVGLQLNFQQLRLNGGRRRFAGWPNSLLRGARWSSFCLRVEESLA